MRPAPAVLTYLRQNPGTACAAYGFICRGVVLGNAAVDGPCTITPQVTDTVYQLNVTAGGTDYFIPYRHGEARYCDVPRNLPDGTMVVTFPMNGCALEVHGRIPANRFYHDADGNSMPAIDANFSTQKFRADYTAMAGQEERPLTIFAREGSDRIVGRNFEHTVISVKRNGRWQVVQTAVVTQSDAMGGNVSTWQVKDYINPELGSFDDF